MGLRLTNSMLNLTLNGLTKFTRDCSRNGIHAVCARRDSDLGLKLSRVSLYSSESPKKCWQCDFPYKSDLFCQKCKTLQEPPESLDYFDILGVKKNYDVQDKEMRKKYRALQNLLHPDRFGNKTEREKQYSENLSSLLNKAYATLTNPLDRGIYLLKLKNLTIPEGTTSLDPMFLMEIMERNEEVQDAANNKDKIKKLVVKNHTILEELSRKASEAFHNNELEEAKKILVKMKYYASLDERLKKIKQDLGIVD
ncbi:iron-sulfur cluster co-chaperone protein HscB, mitochondrial isoform X1 [Fopius arisanus]|uniref:Iron-sulfur cluster co-chaperone protein HscB, mitochondrial isoform X1 n=2 Tax=Fopius arisanus TaxID=64838 RepID=A0A9R1TUE3_9HYME|nr:PREDICTED: iron-sulfur cluster co-chaperone protein HscB, mitochondrial isoform X1 [Fopius arisanus]